MTEVVDAVEDGERAAHAEEEQRHDERPEVPLAGAPEGKALAGRLHGEAHPEQKQALVRIYLSFRRDYEDQHGHAHGPALR